MTENTKETAKQKEERRLQVAQVAVERTTLHFDKLYSYVVPPHLADAVQTGSIVLVPFGKGGRARVGLVAALQECEDVGKLKTIFDAAPEQARLSGELLDLARDLRETTFCTYYEAVKAVLPYGAQYKAVLKDGRPCLQKQLVRHSDTLYAVNEAPGEKKRVTQKQQAALDLLAQAPRTAAQMESMGISRAVLNTLCKNGLLRKESQEKTVRLYEGSKEQKTPLVLSEIQNRVYEQLAALLEAPPAAALLYGVTSSGKTAVFIKLIEKTLSMGRQALMLVPEISLTPQMVYRLKAAFGQRVAVQHSSLSHTERLLQWNQIQQGGADIVVGTRSAVFAPLERIGLIILDEEQEHTYHSENPPRFLAHDIAKQRAVRHGALFLAASATPSIESYYYAKQGRYHLAEMTQRYNGMPLPQVEMIDMRRELEQGNASGISGRLEQKLKEHLARGEQAILLLNRRGYKTVGMCTACGQVLKCPSCSVPMVYHKAEERLLCHYCGKSVSPVPSQCPECGERIKYTGFGTQRVEEELAEKFPAARVLRMDMDTTRKKNAHEEMLAAFARGEYDIMLGTQMVAKGLDFERVTLVGVLGIDQMLFSQGYKAFEQVFSLVTQVVGRGGRSKQPGYALIQTVEPHHPVLQMAARQDYHAFYESEIAFRKLNLYPPFCSICMIGFSGKEEQTVQQAARAMAQIIAQIAAKSYPELPLRVLGPAPMSVAMIQEKYRYKLTLKCRVGARLRQMLRQAVQAYDGAGWSGKASVTIDFYAQADV